MGVKSALGQVGAIAGMAAPAVAGAILGGPFVLPGLFASQAIGTGLSAWAGSKSQDRADAQAREFQRERDAAAAREEAKRNALALLMEKFQQKQTRVTSQRKYSLFMNGLMNSFLSAPPLNPQMPGASDINAEARHLNPEAFNYRPGAIPGVGKLTTALGVLGGVGAAAATGAVYNRIYPQSKKG